MLRCYHHQGSRIYSVHPTKDMPLKKKLSPILLDLEDDPSVVLWRPKRRRWAVWKPSETNGMSFAKLMNSGKTRDAVVNWVRGQIDGGGQLPMMHVTMTMAGVPSSRAVTARPTKSHTAPSTSAPRRL